MKKFIIKEDEKFLNNLISVLDLLKKNNKKRKFLESIDVSINLDIDYKDINQYIYGNVVLPYNIGKKYKIVVFDDKYNKNIICSWGACLAGSNNLIEKIINKDINFNFNLVITTHSFFNKLSNIGYILGPKGLMPNIKFGTITNDLENTVKEFSKNKIIYKNDKFGIINTSIGKINLNSFKLANNLMCLLKSIKKNKPILIKKLLFIKKIFVSSTMGSSYLVNL